MRALLLAAGVGTRLRPLTHILPKCLVPIRGRPLLDYWLETLLDHGVDEVLVNTHYMAPLVSEYIRHSSWASRVTIVHEDHLLGTGGTVLANRTFFQESPFLVAHADNLTLFDPWKFMSRHAERPSGSEVTMMLFETDDPGSCGIVELDESDVVTAFHEKVESPPGNLANAAVYIFQPSVLDRLAALGKDVIDISTEIMPGLIGRIFTFHNTAYHRDIGNMASWAEANREFPLMPSTAENTKAWGALMDGDGGIMKQVVEQLLADPGNR